MAGERIEGMHSDEGAGTRCPLCGGPNGCALAGAAPGADSAASADAAEEPCWCVAQRFPASLLEHARARDGGEACVCRGCLAAFERSDGG